MDKITEIESKLDYFHKPNWSDIIVEKEICNQQDIVATKKISNVLNELNDTFKITNITEKGGFGEDIDIEDGLFGEDTERSPTQQAAETSAKDETRSGVHQAFEQTETSKGAIVTEREQGKNDGKVVGGLEDLEALNFSFGFTQETSCEEKQNEMVSDVHQALKQTETSKGVEEEEDEMPADVDHESVNQDPTAGKDNLIEEMELKTSSENINRQRLTGRIKVASEALRSPYLVREVDITKSITKEDDWVW
ncbi:hypothetical protein L1987_02860 [Smallanthus sonchifolius]|uniref:Uncharacterized protein n=1 Tax=Smallanthus sonchifolius TaxID=185202 RepID=A0ACB9K8Y0_9ASTR|nr:hypothetical protein L1987_02860 [Smallanthus sonchifolius]